MINADIKPHNETLIFVRFSDPNEVFGNKPYVPVDSMAEVKRRLYIRNRTYIVETLTAWLNQRMHALPSHQKQIATCLIWLNDVKISSFFNVCNFIQYRKQMFESFAPGKDSRFINHYNTTIRPIIEFCCQEHE